MIMCGCEEKCFCSKRFATQECIYLKHGVEPKCKITGKKVIPYIDSKERKKIFKFDKKGRFNMKKFHYNYTTSILTNTENGCKVNLKEDGIRVILASIGINGYYCCTSKSEYKRICTILRKAEVIDIEVTDPEEGIRYCILPPSGLSINEIRLILKNTFYKKDDNWNDTINGKMISFSK